ncbi:MAG: insulinase family protein [Planctomycetes bacterium]|nr:insulinase family protein [Planctomycetota bacterium]
MHRTLLAAGFAALVSPLCLAQNVTVEKYSLPNGMTVILHEDHSLPTVVINTWFRVGAQDEPPHRSGFAHLFEHLMFMGTARVPGNQFDILMERGGGANNASTDLHRTNYYSWGPSSLLPTLLYLDADRLEDMGLNMSKEKLDKQRDVVRNELRQSVENAPYGKAGEMVFKLLYTPDHPYYYGVIGTHEDLEAANVANVKDFFATFYVPSNASLVVAGDFKPAEIKPLIAGLFGTIPAGQPVTRKYAPPADSIPVHLSTVKRFTCIDKVELPKVQFTYHSPRTFAAGDAEMDLLADILASGKSSRLYRRLVVQEQLANEVSASQQGFPLGGMFTVDVLTKPDADLAAVERIVDEELAVIVRDGPTQEELSRSQAVVELSKLSALESLQAKADRLNEYEYYWGEPNSFKRDLDRYREASPAAVKKWATEVLRPSERVIINVLPEEPARKKSDRDQRPTEGSVSAFAPPVPEQFTLTCGMPVMLFERHDLPLVSVMLACNPGGGVDPAGKEGVSSLAMKMLTEGAGKLDAAAFAEAVRSLGATFNADADTESAGVHMTMLARNAERGAELFADAVLRPQLQPSSWDRIKSLHIEELKQDLQEPRATASRVGNALLYAPENPYAVPADGTPASVQSLTLDDAKAALSERLLRPENCTLIVAGDITKDRVGQLFGRQFHQFKSQGPAPAKRDSFAFSQAPKGLRVAIVDRPGATQTMVRFAAPGVPFKDASRVQRNLVNTILGGSFTSRLNQNLREDHGYTYGARSGFEMNPSTGAFAAGAAVKADVTGPALREFLTELTKLAAGDISDDEARKARETERSDTVRSFGGLHGLINTAAQLRACNLPFDTVAADFAAIGSATAPDLNAMAKHAYDLDRTVLVLVGDAGVIREQIKDLKLPEPVMLDAEGKPVK